MDVVVRGNSDLGLSEEDQQLLDQMLASKDVSHSVLEALARAQAAAAAAVVASGIQSFFLCRALPAQQPRPMLP